MIVTIFYILSVMYVLKLHFLENFNPIGKEFTGLVLLGLVAILNKK